MKLLARSKPRVRSLLEWFPPSRKKCVFVLNRLFFVMNSTGQAVAAFQQRLALRRISESECGCFASADGITQRQSSSTRLRGDNELLLRSQFLKRPKKMEGPRTSLSEMRRRQVSVKGCHSCPLNS